MSGDNENKCSAADLPISDILPTFGSNKLKEKSHQNWLDSYITSYSFVCLRP